MMDFWSVIIGASSCLRLVGDSGNESLGEGGCTERWVRLPCSASAAVIVITNTKNNAETIQLRTRVESFYYLVKSAIVRHNAVCHLVYTKSTNIIKRNVVPLALDILSMWQLFATWCTSNTNDFALFLTWDTNRKTVNYATSIVVGSSWSVLLLCVYHLLSESLYRSIEQLRNVIFFGLICQGPLRSSGS